MRKSYLFSTVIVILTGLPAWVSAQYIVDYKRQADTYFSQQNYYAAGVYYQKALQLLPDTTGKTYFYPYAFPGTYGKRREKNAAQYQYLVYQLGEAFRKYKDYKSAEKWYGKVIRFKNNHFPLAHLWYGVCLRADGKYREARDQLNQFLSAYTAHDEYRDRAHLELKSCQFALAQSAYPRLADIRKLPEPINDSGSNYAPVVFGKNFYFTSSRPLSGIDARKENPFINKIYHAGISGANTFSKPSVVSLGMDRHTELAAATFGPAYVRMYFTEWQPSKKKGKASHYVIAMSKQGDDSTWSVPLVLDSAVNKEGYDSKEPFLTADGRYVVFSSNRPGGKGGYDLWYCPLDMNGLPSGGAVNMGDAINTPQDETNPYYNYKTHTLVFSSNGRIGLGGFDLYKSKGMIDIGNWSTPQNLGYPVNSAKDDIFYYPAGDTTHFYTSSDRNSVCCLELYNIHLKHIAVAGTVYDCDTQKPLAGARVVLTDSISDHTIGSMETDAAGRYRFEVINRKPLKLHFSKARYFSKNMQVSTHTLTLADTLFSKTLCLKAFEVGKPIIIPNILYDFDKASLRPESKLVLDSLADILKDNPRLIVQMSANTDSIGSDEYNMKLSQRRAQSCVDYLISIGIPAARMKAKGYGESRPIAPNSLPDGSDNPAGRQLNRRTEFTVLKD